VPPSVVMVTVNGVGFGDEVVEQPITAPYEASAAQARRNRAIYQCCHQPAEAIRLQSS
jgi:hypothetical protein